MESVVAVAILAILASTVIGGISMVMSQQVRQQRRLACAELSNRLILMYLDDPETMPDDSLPIGYGNEKYRWEIIENPVQISSARADLAAELEDKTSMTLDRLNAVTVRVWLSEAHNAGSFAPSAQAPTYAITRLIDPVSNITRNPDSLSYAAAHEPPALPQVQTPAIKKAPRAEQSPARQTPEANPRAPAAESPAAAQVATELQAAVGPIPSKQAVASWMSR
jgi:type II secretory pathway pseudopilin PulG